MSGDHGPAKKLDLANEDGPAKEVQRLTTEAAGGENLNDLMKRLGNPPDDVAQSWCQGLRAFKHSHWIFSSDPADPMLRHEAVVDSHGQLRFPELPRWSGAKLDQAAASGDRRPLNRDTWIAAFHESLTVPISTESVRELTDKIATVDTKAHVVVDHPVSNQSDGPTPRRRRSLLRRPTVLATCIAGSALAGLLGWQSMTPPNGRPASHNPKPEQVTAENIPASAKTNAVQSMPEPVSFHSASERVAEQEPRRGEGIQHESAWSALPGRIRVRPSPGEGKVDSSNGIAADMKPSTEPRPLASPLDSFELPAFERITEPAELGLFEPLDNDQRDYAEMMSDASAELPAATRLSVATETPTAVRGGEDGEAMVPDRLPTPRGVKRLEISFHDVEQTHEFDLPSGTPSSEARLDWRLDHAESIRSRWTRPIRSDRPKRTDGIVILHSTDSDSPDGPHVALRFDIRSGRKLKVRVRTAVRLAEHQPWQNVTTDQLDQYATTLANRAVQFDRLQAGFAATYSRASRREKQELKPRRELIRQSSEQLAWYSERVAQLQALVADIATNARFHVQVQTPDE